MAEANQRDLVLRPGEYTFISDENKGKVAVLVGPYKVTLGQTDKPVIFSQEKYRFIPVPNLEDAIKQVICAPKGFYVTLKNPSKDGKFPTTGGSSDTPEMEFGKKVNIPGPTYFSLWP
jgi:major vault protein